MNNSIPAGPAIPVIGTAIVNGVHWLDRLIQSIDYPVDNFVVFNNNGRNQITQELEELKSKSSPYIKEFHLCHLPHNIGCGGAWNMIIKSFTASPYWIITNHDIQFGAGFLESMVFKSQYQDVGMVHCSANGNYVEDDVTNNIGSFECFLIKNWVIQQIGLFDENIYPAYCEDVDYILRLVNNPIKRKVINAPYLHGEENYATTGSQTWRNEDSLREGIRAAHNMNIQYILDKWGCFWDDNWENMQPYKTPFNIPNAPLSFAGYNIESIQKRSLGF